MMVTPTITPQVHPIASLRAGRLGWVAPATGFAVALQLHSLMRFVLLLLCTCFVTAGIAQTVTWDVGTLPATGGSATLTIAAEVDAGTAGQTLTNVVEQTGGPTDATPDNDILEAAVLVSDPEIAVAKMAEVDGFNVTLTFTMANSGNVDLFNLELMDDLDIVFGAGNYTVNTLSSSTGTLHNPAYTGSAPNDNVAVASPTVILAPGTTETITVELTVTSVTDQGNGVGVYYNNAQITGETSTGLTTQDDSSDGDVPDPDVASPTPIIIEIVEQLVVTKRTNTRYASIGDFVDFTITIENPSALHPAQSAILLDTLPVGLSYMPETATLDGVVIEPSLNANRAEWPVGSLAPGQVRTLQFFTVVSSNTPLGTLTNRAQAVTAAGREAYSEVATASVIVEADPIFDCSDIMGTVYFDTNGDGTRDENGGGVAGVVLMTVDGVEITTGKHGRFFIPCADVPHSTRGSNFIIKLDESTLPPGYYVTSENPRVVRVTRGKSGKLGFGIAKAPTVDVRMHDASFVPGKATMPEEAQLYIDQLIRAVAAKPHTVLRMTYYAREEDALLTRRRLKAFEAYFRQEWKKRGLGKAPKIMVMKVETDALPAPKLPATPPPEPVQPNAVAPVSLDTAPRDTDFLKRYGESQLGKGE